MRHSTKVFNKLNGTNLFLAKQFSDMRIVCNVCGKSARLWFEMHSVREQQEHKVGLRRETLECLECLSRMRYRIMAEAVLAECRQRFCINSPSISDLAGRIPNINILDTDAFSPAARILVRSNGYSYPAICRNGRMAGYLT